MKLFTAVMVVIAILGAMAVGWVYESRSKDLLVRAELEIPTDIDFFLSQMDYRVFNPAGDLDYQMQSPYLEHFIKDDISRIEQPRIRVFRENGDWQVNAARGDLLHREEWLQLESAVVLRKLSTNGLQVRSERMLFKPEQDLIASEGRVVIESSGSEISGEDAVFDLGAEVYRLKNTRATYYHANR